MKTIRILIDNDGNIWKDGDAIKITLNGVRAGTHIGMIKTVGVNMMTVQFYENNKFTEVQLMDLATIVKIEPTYPIWLK